MSNRLTEEEVVEFMFKEDDSDISEGGSSDEEGEGVYAYAGQQHFDSAEVASLSEGVVPVPVVASTTHAIATDQDDSSGSKQSAVIEQQGFDLPGICIKYKCIDVKNIHLIR